MKILVVSDTHGRNENFRDAIRIEKPDRIYHLGDGMGVDDEFWQISKVPAEFVRGNCDYASNLPEYLVLNVGKHVLFLAHGHSFGVNYDLNRIRGFAREKGADIVLYGHTHVPDIDYSYGMMVANPGSLTQPRQASREHTYMVIDVDEEGELKLSLHSLEEYDRKQKSSI